VLHGASVNKATNENSREDYGVLQLNQITNGHQTSVSLSVNNIQAHMTNACTRTTNEQTIQGSKSGSGSEEWVFFKVIRECTTHNSLSHSSQRGF